MRFCHDLITVRERKGRKRPQGLVCDHAQLQKELLRIWNNSVTLYSKSVCCKLSEKHTQWARELHGEKERRLIGNQYNEWCHYFLHHCTARYSRFEHHIDEFQTLSSTFWMGKLTVNCIIQLPGLEIKRAGSERTLFSQLLLDSRNNWEK